MTITAYSVMLAPTVTVQVPNNSQTVIVRLRLPNAGSFVVFGRIVITNQSASAANAGVMLTTFDGETVLDQASATIGGGSFTGVFLQGILTMGTQNVNEIVDIRCFVNANVSVNCISLNAISVDATASGLA